MNVIMAPFSSVHWRLANAKESSMAATDLGKQSELLMKEPREMASSPSVPGREPSAMVAPDQTQPSEL